MDKTIFEKDNFKEISLEFEDGQSLSVLINGTCGWLMYLRDEGDSGYSSRNSDLEEEDILIPFFLSNGQMDSYPKSWTLPIDLIYKAISYFEEFQSKPPFIIWHDDTM